MSTNNEENDSPEFFNFDGMSAPLKDEKKDIQERKKLNLKIIIIITSIILVITVLAISIYFIIKAINKEPPCKSGYFYPRDAESNSESECTKCSLENCDKCSGTKISNICTSCFPNYFSIKEGDILIKCNPCDIGEDDKCLSCSEEINKCSKCNIGYKLENGKCILNYSFKATYFANSKTKITLINSNYKDKIKEVIIDGNIQTEINNVYELEYGNHIVYILLDISPLSNYSPMFSFCGDLKEIYFSSQFNNIEIKSMDRMFNGCKALTSIDFGNVNIKSITNLEYMFIDCSSLKNINIPNFDISKITSMKGMFLRCIELEYIEFPKIQTKELKNIDDMFSGCSKLKSLDLSNFDTKQITSFSNLFNGCNSLTSLNISKFDTTNVNSMIYMFKDCFSLSSLDLSNFDVNNLGNINGIFSGCSNLKSINLSSFKSNKISSLSEMFKDCISLISLDLSNFNTEEVEGMNGMFSGCTSLTSLNLSNFNTQKVKYMSSMFNGCSSLTSIDLSNFKFNSPISTVNFMFFGCSKLIYIDISNFTFSSIPSLFDNDIPSEGTIKVKDETVGNKIKAQIPNWNFIYN